MADHYVRWLIAGGNSFRPAAASIVKLAARLQKEKWLPESGGITITTIENTFGEGPGARDQKEKARREPQPAVLERLEPWLKSGDGENGELDEVRLVWPVAADGRASGLRYPLSREPSTPAAYTVEIHRADEYVYPIAETIGRVPTICNCKEDLFFEWDEEEVVPAFEWSGGIFAECEECSRTFEPLKGTALMKNPFGGASEELRGGAAYRFALAVVCDGWAADPSLRFHPELVQLFENEFGRTFYEVGALV